VRLGAGDGLLPGPGSASGTFGAALHVVDVDNDGTTALYIGAPGAREAARRGSGRVFGVSFAIDRTVAAGDVFGQHTTGIAGAAEVGDGMGNAFTSTDVDGDGHPDLVVGLSGEAIGSRSGAGAFLLLPGSPTGFDLARDQFVDQRTIGVGGKAESADTFAGALG
jgi:hypothetical protein